MSDKEGNLWRYQENSIPESEIKLFWPQTCGDVHYVSNHEAGVVK